MVATGITVSTHPPSLNLAWQPEPAIVAQGYLDTARQIRSMGVPLEDSARYMAESTKRKFDDEGPGWDPLDESTIASRHSQGFSPDPILDRTGNLKRVASQYNIWSVDGQQGVAFVRGLPSHVNYGRFHQTGTRFMPARPFLIITPEDEQEISNIFEEWLEERISSWEAGIRGPRQPHWRFRDRLIL